MFGITPRLIRLPSFPVAFVTKANIDAWILLPISFREFRALRLTDTIQYLLECIEGAWKIAFYALIFTSTNVHAVLADSASCPEHLSVEYWKAGGGDGGAGGACRGCGGGCGGCGGYQPRNDMWRVRTIVCSFITLSE